MQHEIPKWLKARHHDATVETWEQMLGGGWKHKSASICESARIGASASIERQCDCVVVNNMGSRNAPLCVYRDRTHGLGVSTGCFYGSVKVFLSVVRAKYADGHEHRIAYEAAIDMATKVVRRWVPAATVKE